MHGSWTRNCPNHNYHGIQLFMVSRDAVIGRKITAHKWDSFANEMTFLLFPLTTRKSGTLSVVQPVRSENHNGLSGLWLAHEGKICFHLMNIWSTWKFAAVLQFGFPQSPHLLFLLKTKRSLQNGQAPEP